MKKIILAMVVMLGTVGVTFGQAPKFGHINSQKLMELMPERTTIQTELENYAKQLETQLQMMTQEYQKKVQEYQTNEATWGELVKQSKVQQITDLEGRIQEFQSKAQQDLNAKEQALIEPLIKKAKDAINAVAKEKGYTYVFDTSTGAVLTYPAGDDILPFVKKYLGII